MASAAGTVRRALDQREQLEQFMEPIPVAQLDMLESISAG